MTGEQLYRGNANRVKPDWNQLGQATRDVWNEYAAAGITLDEAQEEEPDCWTNPCLTQSSQS